MGSESSSNSESSNSESSNSADGKKELEVIDEKIKDQNAMIQRVWIAKKSISVTDEHIYLNNKEEKKLSKLHKNLFKMENRPSINIKHWALLLELSNDYFINIQFGRNGFSLKEFEKTEIEGENIFYAINETWGERDAPISFCYLGKANIRYQILKSHLRELKEEEANRYEAKGKTFYHLLSKNCQEFCCDIEKYLFGKKIIWHSFDYYINEFYSNFFPKMDITKWKSKYEENLKNKNEEILQNNLNTFKNYNTLTKHGKTAILYYICKKTMYFKTVYVPVIDEIDKIIFSPGIRMYAAKYGQKIFSSDYKSKIKQLYSLNIDDYLIH